jgi:hypothetical protein
MIPLIIIWLILNPPIDEVETTECVTEQGLQQGLRTP